MRFKPGETRAGGQVGGGEGAPERLAEPSDPSPMCLTILSPQCLGSGRDASSEVQQVLWRSAIEPEIGHMKSNTRLSRCPVEGTFGGAMFAVLCGCGHTIRKILAHIGAPIIAILAVVPATVSPEIDQPDVPAAA